MSVLRVFGSNLRLLCRAHSSQANVANQLDIGKVQFQRYLNSSSFPKPNLLASICDFFGADARILTEPLDAEEARLIVQRSKSPRPHRGPHQYAHSEPLANAIGWAAPWQDYFPQESVLADGNYELWQNSLSQPGMVALSIIKVRSTAGERLVRGFVPRAYFPADLAMSLRSKYPNYNAREYRGVVMDSIEGATILLFYPPPSQWVSHLFMSTNFVGYDGSLSGYISFGRREYPGMGRLGRAYLRPIEPGFRPLMAACRQPTWRDLAEAPQSVRAVLEKPLG
ncbi:hypothetical protein [Frigidibacter sp. SD6-1]|uniref:hypothetical protein n=1 Tax=Frigidibacter sp. SD6-1 TaxID=3032581 RepID=UPI0024DFCA8B|nr:hypothetical protein [Frigidibacter sp. SD6-1]